MVDRIQFWVLYVGSAAMVALLAACLSSPRVATFDCSAGNMGDTDGCQLVATLAVIAEGGEMNLEGLAPNAAQAATPGPGSAQ